LSSSGVQKAIQSALAAAIVSNTLLRKPALAEAAMRFYRSSLLEASSRHSRWAAEYYRKVAEQRGGRFWEDRAAGAKQSEPAPRRIAVDDHMLAATPVVISPQTELVETPCLDGDFVALQSALRHPNLEGPVTWLGHHAVPPLLQQMETPATALQLAISWSSHMPLSAAIAIASWLLSHGILVDEAGQEISHA
jgi:hypothetical protein